MFAKLVDWEPSNTLGLWQLITIQKVYKPIDNWRLPPCQVVRHSLHPLTNRPTIPARDNSGHWQRGWRLCPGIPSAISTWDFLLRCPLRNHSLGDAGHTSHGMIFWIHPSHPPFVGHWDRTGLALPHFQHSLFMFIPYSMTRKTVLLCITVYNSTITKLSLVVLKCFETLFVAPTGWLPIENG